MELHLNERFLRRKRVILVRSIMLKLCKVSLKYLSCKLRVTTQTTLKKISLLCHNCDKVNILKHLFQMNVLDFPSFCNVDTLYNQRSVRRFYLHNIDDIWDLFFRF